MWLVVDCLFCTRAMLTMAVGQFGNTSRSLSYYRPT